MAQLIFAHGDVVGVKKILIEPERRLNRSEKFRLTTPSAEGISLKATSLNGRKTPTKDLKSHEFKKAVLADVKPFFLIFFNFLNPKQGLYRIVSQVFNRQDKRYPGLGFVQRCMGRARKSRVDSQVKLQLDNWEDHRKQY